MHCGSQFSRFCISHFLIPAPTDKYSILHSYRNSNLFLDNYVELFYYNKSCKGKIESFKYNHNPNTLRNDLAGDEHNEVGEVTSTITDDSPRVGGFHIRRVLFPSSPPTPCIALHFPQSQHRSHLHTLLRVSSNEILP